MFRSDRTNSLVMRGLDPRIHAGSIAMKSIAVAACRRGRGMDCRVKPGNDASGSAIQLDRNML
jgi:hypothetical protein